MKRASILVLALTMAWASPARAQGRWVDAYDQGVQAVKKQQWSQAVENLTKAIAANSHAEANKTYEGVHSEDYFPYYYRGLAYLNLKEYDKAQRDFKLAAQTRMPDPLMRDLQAKTNDVATALASQSSPPAPSPTPAAPPPEVMKAPVPAAPDPHTQATDLVKQGGASLAQGKTADAQASFQEAQKLWPQVPGAQDGLAAVASRNKYNALKANAAQARATGQLADAATAYEQAKAADPQQYAADHLDQQLDLIRTDLAHQQQTARAQSMANGANLLNGGLDLARQHRYAEAEAKFQAAVAADPNNTQAADALAKSRQYGTAVATARSLEAQGKLNGASVSLNDAEALDSDRFKTDGLDRVLADINRRLAPAVKSEASGAPGTAATPPIYDALVAYLKGDMPSAIRLLEPVASSDATLSASARAEVHGYLGAAYATSALEARSAGDRDTWRGKAIAEFKRADTAEPGFQLPGRLVSPAIQSMVDAARHQ